MHVAHCTLQVYDAVSLPGVSQVCSLYDDAVSPVIGQLQKLSSAYDVAMVMTKNEDDMDKQQQQLQLEDEWLPATLHSHAVALLLLLLAHCYDVAVFSLQSPFTHRSIRTP